jgi:hypothetical protein
MNDRTPTEGAAELAATAIRAAVLDPLRDLTLLRHDIEGSGAASLESPRREDLWLADEILPFFEKQPWLVAGAGVAFAPGAFVDTPTAIDWWRRARSSTIHYVRYDFNPQSINYYDYASQPWFRAAQSQPALIGPYVDAGGINVNTVTLAAPVQTRSGIHIIGCDLSLAALETIFIQSVGATHPALVLASAAGRVLASNTANHTIGARAPRPAGTVVPMLRDEDDLRADWCVYPVNKEPLETIQLQP